MIGFVLLGGCAQPKLMNPYNVSSPPNGHHATAPLIKPEALWDGRKKMPFKAMDFPKMAAASNANFLDDDDYILGVAVGGECRAYPTRYIWFHHIVNDKVLDPVTGRDVYYAVTYCSVCNTGIRYDPLINGKPVMLDFYGLYNGVATLCERETGSVFLQVPGEFATGPLTGARLRAGPLLDTTWANWKKLHPDTLVMSPDTPFSKQYNPKKMPEPRGYGHFPAPYFRPTVTRSDTRLPAFEKVLGVSVTPTRGKSGNAAIVRRAYPLGALGSAGGAVNDTVGDTPIAVLYEKNVASANAVCRRIDGRALTFFVQNGAFYDKETGTRWSLEGRGEEGAMAGRELAQIDNHLSQWYGWVAYFPETTIYGRKGPPQPVDGFADAHGAIQAARAER
jgi:hypothetical protein